MPSGRPTVLAATPNCWDLSVMPRQSRKALVKNTAAVAPAGIERIWEGKLLPGILRVLSETGRVAKVERKCLVASSK